MNLKNKKILITGASGGIGKCLVEKFNNLGSKIIATGTNEEKLSDLKKNFPNIDIEKFRLNEHEKIESFIEKIDKTFNGLEILVNNAGANWGAPLAEYPDEGFEKVISTNLNAVFALTRDAVPLLKKSATTDNPSRIVNIGSMDGLHVPVVQRVPTFAYSASKAALHHLTRALAVELGPEHITVNAVAPGFFESRMTDYIFEHYLEDIQADCPLRRIGQAEEIAGVVIYLVSRAGNYTNGAVIPVDGGTNVSKGIKPWDER